MLKRLISLGLALAAALVLAPAASAATTFTVGGIGDGGDVDLFDGVCAASGGTCTLRAAIEQSNATPSGTPHTINLAQVAGQTIIPVSALPTITRDETFVDGCGVSRYVTNELGLVGLPKPPVSAPCVGLHAPGSLPAGITVSARDVYVQGLAITGFDKGVRLWGADEASIGGNWLGLRLNGTTVAGNGVGISVAGRASPPDPATDNVIGGYSSADDVDAAACDSYCNVIVGSTTSGIDLTGTGTGETPAGGDCGGQRCSTYVHGNWIGVTSADGSPAVPNATAISIGGSIDTEIGDLAPGGGNVIAGNTKGVDHGSGGDKVLVFGGLFGISPDREASVPNGQWNARLRGGHVQGAQFGPAAIGLELDGPSSQVIGSRFADPAGTASGFTTAAIRVGPDGDGTWIGGASGTTPPLCLPSVLATCNTIGDVATAAPAILVDGADDVTIVRTAIGYLTDAPINGPAIRVTGTARGAMIGDDENPELQNQLFRRNWPAVEIGEQANGIVVAGNSGLATGAPDALFTDLLPVPGPGNSGTANSGVQPPVITQSTVKGVGGTGVPGAAVRVQVQERPVIPAGEDGSPNVTVPAEPGRTTVEESGVWGIAFATPVKAGQRLLASQTGADGSSEYATMQASADSPPVIVTFTSGPTDVVAERSATFTFVANRVVKRLECSVDAGAFVACSSPLTLSNLDLGGHQLRVRGVDPTDSAGNVASRTWIVEIPQPLTQTPGPTGRAAAVRFTQVASLPSARRCISRRTLRIRIRHPKGSKVKSAQARIGGRRAKTRRGAGSITLSLKGLPRGRFVARVKVTLTDGRVINGTRTYRTCAKKKSRR